MWHPGEVVAWRGIRRGRVWHVQPTIVVKDSPEEVVLTLLPGTECLAEKTYPLGKHNSKRWWDFQNNDWELQPYTWKTNRLLLIFEPQKWYSTILFWHHASNTFLYYYINFQVPFERHGNNADTLDLELDLIVRPDFSTEWKDEDDYQHAQKHEPGFLDLVKPVELTKPEILDRVNKKAYPFDGSWLNWLPDPAWSPPTLPENWDTI